MYSRWWHGRRHARRTRRHSYAELLDHSSPMELGEGRTILVLELSKLIELKRIAGRPKDLAVLPVLEATLELTRR